MEIGTRIKELRVGKHLSQEALANELNVSRQAVTKWESNTSKPSTANLLGLCEIFDISLDELVSGKVDEKKNEERGWKSGTKLKCALLISSIIFSLFSTIAVINNIRCLPPENAIGYADAETGIIVFGTPTYLYLLCGFTVILIIATVLVFLRSYYKKWRRKNETS